MIDQNTKKPYINIIYGNFYEPAYSDKASVEETMKWISRLGYTSVMLDTKDSEDFRECFAGGEKSIYVAMQEYMQQAAKKYGLTYNYLVLYMCGDNLYPHIRTSKPVLGESIRYIDGREGNWYKYWSDKARQVQKEHVDQIMKAYGKGHTTCLVDGKPVKPVCSMWDPVVAASFDEEGKNRYRAFLKRQYRDDINAVNKAYGLQASSFEELEPEEYWFEVRFEKEKEITPEDIEKLTAKFVVRRDNLLWRQYELKEYFAAMQKLLKEENPDLYLCPDLSQWGYFLNIYGRSQVDHDNDYSDLWDTAIRGIDMYELSPFLDATHFITVPTTWDAYPDPYVVSCQHSMMRVMNTGREWVGGIYWGRYIYRDLYEFLTPEEIIGSMAACGIDGYTSYGANGLDDGGLVNRMDDVFCDSLTRGNAWLCDMIPERGKVQQSEIALLFPAEMSLFEQFEVEGNEIRRMDLLGFYKMCCDLGFRPDVISKKEIREGCLKKYKVLIAPMNDCYHAMDHEEEEKLLKAWVEDGGVYLHGPKDAIAKKVFGVVEKSCEKRPFRKPGEDIIIPQGICFSEYEEEETISSYIDDGKTCIGSKTCGKGKVYSFGVMVGASYCAKNIPHVPYNQGNKEMYPWTMSGTKVMEEILLKHLERKVPLYGKGIEVGEFENGYVVVNHRSTSVTIPENDKMKYCSTYSKDEVLMPHSTAWIPKEGEEE